MLPEHSSYIVNLGSPEPYQVVHKQPEGLPRVANQSQRPLDVVSQGECVQGLLSKFYRAEHSEHWNENRDRPASNLILERRQGSWICLMESSFGKSTMFLGAYRQKSSPGESCFMVNMECLHMTDFQREGRTSPSPSTPTPGSVLAVTGKRCFSRSCLLKVPDVLSPSFILWCVLLCFGCISFRGGWVIFSFLICFGVVMIS